MVRTLSWKTLSFHHCYNVAPFNLVNLRTDICLKQINRNSPTLHRSFSSSHVSDVKFNAGMHNAFFFFLTTARATYGETNVSPPDCVGEEMIGTPLHQCDGDRWWRWKWLWFLQWCAATESAALVPNGYRPRPISMCHMRLKAGVTVSLAVCVFACTTKGFVNHAALTGHFGSCGSTQEQILVQRSQAQGQIKDDIPDTRFNYSMWFR